MKFKIHYEIESYMITPTWKFGSVFYPSLSIFYEDHNKECYLTKYEQISKCGCEKNYGIKIYGINEK